MTLEDRLSTHLKDTSAKLSGRRPPEVDLVVAAAGARGILTRLMLGGGALAACLVVAGAMALPRSDEPHQPTPAAVSPFAELGDRQQRASDEVVFMVTTDTPAYWRVASLDIYEGGTWKVAGNFAPGAPGLDEGATEEGERQTIRHDVEVVNLDAIWLPAAPEPVQLVADGAFSVTVNQATNTMAVPYDRSDSDGLRYSVVSSVAVPTPEELRDAAPRAGTEITAAEIAGVDLSPDAVPAEIRSQAQDLAVGSPTDYDRVLAILDHLRSLTVVDAPEAAPGGTDPAVRLLETGQGSNEDFASAMALLARALGIPSRVAIGFTPGEQVDGPGDGTGRVTFRVTNHDAHAWTEIYFPGVGWVGFEPTPGQSMPLAEQYAGTS